MTDREIYLMIRDDVTRFAAALVGPSEANDVVSIVVTRFLASDRSLADLEDPRAYVMKSVFNEARSTWKQRARRSEEPLLISGAGALDPIQDVEMVDLIGRLPAQQRAATYLTYWLGMSSAEVSELLGIRPATVRRYLHLARQRLKEVIDDTR